MSTTTTTKDDFPPPPVVDADGGGASTPEGKGKPEDEEEGGGGGGEEEPSSDEDVASDEEEEEEGGEDGSSSSPKSEEKMKMYPAKHLAELPPDDVRALVEALKEFAGKVKYKTAQGNEGDVNSAALARLVLSRESLLHGASWMVSQVESIGDEEVRRKVVEQSGLWKALLKIVLRDPILTCGTSVVVSKKKSTMAIKLDVSLPSFDEMKSYLFYSKSGRKRISVTSEKYGTVNAPRYPVDEDNIYFYYLKQLISVHKVKFHNDCNRYYELDASYLNPDRSTVHAKELLLTSPIWSHGDMWSDGFVGGTPNMGVSTNEEIVVLAYKGRAFKRFDLVTTCPLDGGRDVILPVDCSFFGCGIGADVLQSTMMYPVGKDAANATYEAIWNACVAPATVKRHIKERIKSAPHSALYKWYRESKTIGVVVPGVRKDEDDRRSGRGGKACAKICDSVVVERPLVDALWEASMCDGKASVAHMHVMKNGDVLCIFEDSLYNKNFAPGCRKEKYASRGFTVVWYRFESTRSPYANTSGATGASPPPPASNASAAAAAAAASGPKSTLDDEDAEEEYDPLSRCAVTVVARFNFSDFRKTRTFVNGKVSRPYPVSVKNFVTRECVQTVPGYGTSGACSAGYKDKTGVAPDPYVGDYDGRPGCGCPTSIINRIASAEVEDCILDEGTPGIRLCFAMLVDVVEFDGNCNEVSVQDEVWSATCFVVSAFPPFPARVVGVVATRLNKEHVWGRATNDQFLKRFRGGPLGNVSGSGYANVTSRGFYDRKRLRMCIDSSEHGKKVPCTSYFLDLSDFVEKKQGQTLTINWNESFKVVQRSIAVALLFPPASSAPEERGKRGGGRGRGKPAGPPTDALPPPPPFDFDDEEIKFYGKVEPVNHKTLLTVHPLPGPYGKSNASIVLGLGRRKSSAPVVLYHRKRGRYAGPTAADGLDVIGGFDVHVPSNAFTSYERDATGAVSPGKYGEDYDVNFDPDKAWIVDNLIVALKTDPSGKRNHPCARVYKLEIPSTSFGATSSVAKPTANGAAYVMQSTENIYLLNSTKIETKRAVNPKLFYGSRKALLGGTFKTSEHVVLLIKDDARAKLIRTARPGSRSSSMATMAKSEAKKGNGKNGSGAKDCDFGTCKGSGYRTVRVYAKLWKASWATVYRYDENADVDDVARPSSNAAEYAEGYEYDNDGDDNDDDDDDDDDDEDREDYAVDDGSSSSVPPAGSAKSASGIGASIGSAMERSKIEDFDAASKLFYASETMKVCTNPWCGNTGCHFKEQKTDLVDWHFCSQECHDAFPPRGFFDGHLPSPLTDGPSPTPSSSSSSSFNAKTVNNSNKTGFKQRS